MLTGPITAAPVLAMATLACSVAAAGALNFVRPVSQFPVSLLLNFEVAEVPLSTVLRVLGSAAEVSHLKYFCLCDWLAVQITGYAKPALSPRLIVRNAKGLNELQKSILIHLQLHLSAESFISNPHFFWRNSPFLS
jgi:hypothetical protein